MRLKSVKLTHFRGYRDTTVIPIDEAMTGIVGRNDYGKSTILEALAIFFESGDVKADKSDMNCFSLAEGLEQFEIACEFDDLPEALVLPARALVPRLPSRYSGDAAAWAVESYVSIEVYNAHTHRQIRPQPHPRHAHT